MNPNYYQQGPPIPNLQPYRPPCPPWMNEYSQPMPIPPHFTQNQPQPHYSQIRPLMNNNYPPHGPPMPMTSPHHHQWPTHPQHGEGLLPCPQIPNPGPHAQTRTAPDVHSGHAHASTNSVPLQLHSPHASQSNAAAAAAEANANANPLGKAHNPVPTSSSISKTETRIYTGVVTSVESNFGFVDSEIYFENSVIQGPVKKLNVGDYVYLEATKLAVKDVFNIKWKCLSVVLLEDRTIKWDHRKITTMIIVPFRLSEDDEPEMVPARSSPQLNSLTTEATDGTEQHKPGSKIHSDKSESQSTLHQSENQSGKSNSKTTINPTTTGPLHCLDENISESPNSGNLQQNEEVTIIFDERIQGENIPESEPIQDIMNPPGETLSSDANNELPDSVQEYGETEEFNANLTIANDHTIQQINLANGQRLHNWNVAGSFDPGIPQTQSFETLEMEIPSNIEIKAEKENEENQLPTRNAEPVSNPTVATELSTDKVTFTLSAPIKEEVKNLDEGSMDSNASTQILPPSIKPAVAVTEDQSDKLESGPILNAPAETTQTSSAAEIKPTINPQPSRTKTATTKKPEGSKGTKKASTSETRKRKLDEKSVSAQPTSKDSKTKLESPDKRSRHERNEVKQDGLKRTAVATSQATGSHRRSPRADRRSLQRRGDNDNLGFNNHENKSTRSRSPVPLMRQPLLPTPIRRLSEPNQRDHEENTFSPRNEFHSDSNYGSNFNHRNVPPNVSVGRFTDTSREPLRSETEHSLSSAYRNPRNSLDNDIRMGQAPSNRSIRREEKYCSYHQQYGHSTDECRAYKRKITICTNCGFPGHDSSNCNRRSR